MNRLIQACVWLSRIHRCRGFGVQSPTDYRFVCHVINQHSPYYAYEQLGTDEHWLQRKLGRLYFRIVNERQPQTVLDGIGAEPYVKAGCNKARITHSLDKIDMAFLPIKTNYQELFNCCDNDSVVVFQDIHRNMPLWHSIEYDARTAVTFDLYYCGIVLFDKKRSKHNYVINF